MFLCIYILQAPVHSVDLPQSLPAAKKRNSSRVLTFSYRESNVEEITKETFKASCITPASDTANPPPKVILFIPLLLCWLLETSSCLWCGGRRRAEWSGRRRNPDPTKLAEVVNKRWREIFQKELCTSLPDNTMNRFTFSIYFVDDAVQTEIVWIWIQCAQVRLGKWSYAL